MGREERVGVGVDPKLSPYCLGLDSGLLSLPYDGRVAEVEGGDAVAVEAAHVIGVAGLQLLYIRLVDDVATEDDPLLLVVDPRPAMKER